MITLLAGSLPPTSLQSIGCVFCISPWKTELSLLVCCTLRVAFPGRPDICKGLIPPGTEQCRGALTTLSFIDFLGHCLWGVPAADCRSWKGSCRAMLMVFHVPCAELSEPFLRVSVGIYRESDGLYRNLQLFCCSWPKIPVDMECLVYFL